MKTKMEVLEIKKDNKKHLTYSSTSCFKRCRRDYYYSYVEKWKPVKRKLYYDVGTAFHKALETYYKDKNSISVLKTIVDYYNKIPTSGYDFFEKQLLVESRTLISAVVARYIQHYGRSEDFEVIDTEMKFTVPIINPETGRPSTKYCLSGILDMLIKMDGNYWLWENKTTDRIDANYKKRLFLDNQIIVYVDAIQRYLGIKVKGVVYNVAIKSIPKQPIVLKNGSVSKAKNQDTTEEVFREFLINNGFNESDYEDFLDYLANEKVKKEYFYREYLVFPNQLIDEWRMELWNIQKDISSCMKKGSFYKNTSNCIGFGTCDFFNVCSSIDRQYVLSNEFVRKEFANEEFNGGT